MSARAVVLTLLSVVVTLQLVAASSVAYSTQPHGGVSISAVTLLLPNHQCSSRLKPVSHPLQASGGCFRWHSSAPHLVKVQPKVPYPHRNTSPDSVRNPDPSLCFVNGMWGSTEAFVIVSTESLAETGGHDAESAGAGVGSQASDVTAAGSAGVPKSYQKQNPTRRSAWVWAEDIATGRRAECEVYIDRIHSLQIMTSTKRINIGDTESLRVQAFGREGDLFSSVEGLPFEWSHTSEQVARRLSFAEANIVVSPTLHHLEEEGFDTDVLPIQGLAPGRTTFTSRLLCPGPRVEATVEMLVTEPLGIYPPLIRMCPSSSARLRLYSRQLKSAVVPAVASASSASAQSGRETSGDALTPSPTAETVEGHRVLRMPSAQYKWAAGDSSIVEVNEELGIITARKVGHTEVLVEDQSLQETACRADAVVVRPARMEVFLFRAQHPSSRPSRGSDDVPELALREAASRSRGFRSIAEWDRSSSVRNAPWPRCDGSYHITQGRRYTLKVILYDEYDRPIDDCDGLFAQITSGSSITISPSPSASGSGAAPWQPLVDPEPGVIGTNEDDLSSRAQLVGSWVDIKASASEVGASQITLTLVDPADPFRRPLLTGDVKIYVEPPVFVSRFPYSPSRVWSSGLTTASASAAAMTVNPLLIPLPSSPLPPETIAALVRTAAGENQGGDAVNVLSQTCGAEVSASGGSGSFIWSSADSDIAIPDPKITMSIPLGSDYDSFSSHASRALAEQVGVSQLVSTTRFARIVASGARGATQIRVVDRCNLDGEYVIPVEVSPVGQLCRVPADNELLAGGSLEVEYHVKDYLGRPFDDCSCLRVAARVEEGKSAVALAAPEAIPCSDSCTLPPQAEVPRSTLATLEQQQLQLATESSSPVLLSVNPAAASAGSANNAVVAVAAAARAAESILESLPRPPQTCGCFRLVLRGLDSGFAKVTAQVIMSEQAKNALQSSPGMTVKGDVGAMIDKAVAAGIPGPYPGFLPQVTATFAVYKPINPQYHTIAAAVGTSVPLPWQDGPLPWPCQVGGFCVDPHSYGACRPTVTLSPTSAVTDALLRGGPLLAIPNRGPAAVHVANDQKSPGSKCELVSHRTGAFLTRHDPQITSLDVSVTMPAQEGVLAVTSSVGADTKRELTVTCLAPKPEGVEMHLTSRNIPCPSNPSPHSSSTTVRVSCYPRICLSRREIQLSIGQEFPITLTTPDHPLRNNLTFISESPDVASVNESGLVTAHALGVTVIRAFYSDAPINSLPWQENGLHDILVVHVVFAGFEIESGHDTMVVDSEAVVSVIGSRGERPGSSAFDLVSVEWGVELENASEGADAASGSAGFNGGDSQLTNRLSPISRGLFLRPIGASPQLSQFATSFAMGDVPSESSDDLVQGAGTGTGNSRQPSYRDVLNSQRYGASRSRRLFGLAERAAARAGWASTADRLATASASTSAKGLETLMGPARARAAGGKGSTQGLSATQTPVSIVAPSIRISALAPGTYTLVARVRVAYPPPAPAVSSVLSTRQKHGPGFCDATFVNATASKAEPSSRNEVGTPALSFTKDGDMLTGFVLRKKVDVVPSLALTSQSALTLPPGAVASISTSLDNSPAVSLDYSVSLLNPPSATNANEEAQSWLSVSPRGSLTVSSQSQALDAVVSARATPVATASPESVQTVSVHVAVRQPRMLDIVPDALIPATNPASLLGTKRPVTSDSELGHATATSVFRKSLARALTQSSPAAFNSLAAALAASSEPSFLFKSIFTGDASQNNVFSEPLCPGFIDGPSYHYVSTVEDLLRMEFGGAEPSGDDMHGSQLEAARHAADASTREQLLNAAAQSAKSFTERKKKRRQQKPPRDATFGSASAPITADAQDAASLPPFLHVDRRVHNVTVHLTARDARGRLFDSLELAAREGVLVVESSRPDLLAVRSLASAQAFVPRGAVYYNDSQPIPRSPISGALATLSFSAVAYPTLEDLLVEPIVSESDSTTRPQLLPSVPVRVTIRATHPAWGSLPPLHLDVHVASPRYCRAAAAIPTGLRLAVPLSKRALAPLLPTAPVYLRTQHFLPLWSSAFGLSNNPNVLNSGLSGDDHWFGGSMNSNTGDAAAVDTTGDPFVPATGFDRKRNMVPGAKEQDPAKQIEEEEQEAAAAASSAAGYPAARVSLLRLRYQQRLQRALGSLFAAVNRHALRRRPYVLAAGNVADSDSGNVIASLREAEAYSAASSPFSFYIRSIDAEVGLALVDVIPVPTERSLDAVMASIREPVFAASTAAKANRKGDAMTSPSAISAALWDLIKDSVPGKLQHPQEWMRLLTAAQAAFPSAAELSAFSDATAGKDKSMDVLMNPNFNPLGIFSPQEVYAYAKRAASLFGASLLSPLSSQAQDLAAEISAIAKLASDEAQQQRPYLQRRPSRVNLAAELESSAKAASVPGLVSKQTGLSFLQSLGARTDLLSRYIDFSRPLEFTTVDVSVPYFNTLANTIIKCAHVTSVAVSSYASAVSRSGNAYTSMPFPPEALPSCRIWALPSPTTAASHLQSISTATSAPATTALGLALTAAREATWSALRAQLGGAEPGTPAAAIASSLQAISGADGISTSTLSPAARPSASGFWALPSMPLVSWSFSRGRTAATLACLAAIHERLHSSSEPGTTPRQTSLPGDAKRGSFAHATASGKFTSQLAALAARYVTEGRLASIGTGQADELYSILRRHRIDPCYDVLITTSPPSGSPLSLSSMVPSFGLGEQSGPLFSAHLADPSFDTVASSENTKDLATSMAIVGTRSHHDVSWWGRRLLAAYLEAEARDKSDLERLQYLETHIGQAAAAGSEASQGKKPHGSDSTSRSEAVAAWAKNTATARQETLLLADEFQQQLRLRDQRRARESQDGANGEAGQEDDSASSGASRALLFAIAAILVATYIYAKDFIHKLLSGGGNGRAQPQAQALSQPQVPTAPAPVPELRSPLAPVNQNLDANGAMGYTGMQGDLIGVPRGLASPAGGLGLTSPLHQNPASRLSTLGVNAGLTTPRRAGTPFRNVRRDLGPSSDFDDLTM